MQPEDLHILEESFHRAGEAGPAAHAAIVRELERIRPALASLLAQMLRTDGPDPTPALRIELDWPPIPSSVGPYLVGERLGAGGFGVVHLAEQSQPVARQVAIKFIQRTTDGARFLDRFTIERRALATLNHPCIPRLLDAGTTSDGRPYLVMEYVPGTPITQHCRENNLPVEARLRLMARVCDAIAHAHAKNVLHRDIKRGNVLVARRRGWDEPKVIDFGISKIVLGDLASSSPSHPEKPDSDPNRSLAIGTPSIMAPEQFRGEPPDHRTDLYTIGLLLYELLTDLPPFPFDPTAEGLERRRERVLNDVPTAPSRSAAPVPWQHEANRLSHAVRLDETILRCLQADPSLRPASASGLADTLRAFAGEDDSAESIAAAIEQGHALEYAGELPNAERVLIEIVPRARRLLGLNHPLTFRAEMLLAVSIQEQDRAAEAEQCLRDLHERQCAVLGGDHPETLDTHGHLALCIDEAGRTEEAFPMHRKVYEARRRVLGPDHDLTLIALNNLGGSHYKLEHLEDCYTCFLAAAEARERLFGPDDPRAILPRANVGTILVKMRRLDEAEPHVRRTTEGFVRTLGPDHPGSIIAVANLANVLRLLKRFDEAESTATECADRAISALGPNHTHTRGAMMKLLNILDDRAAAEPDSGAAARAAAWRVRVETLGMRLAQV